MGKGYKGTSLEHTGIARFPSGDAEKSQGSCMLSLGVQARPHTAHAVLPSLYTTHWQSFGCNAPGESEICKLFFFFFPPESQQYLHPRRTGVSLRQPARPEGAVQLLLAEAELIAMHGTRRGDPTKTSASRSHRICIMSAVRIDLFR